MAGNPSFSDLVALTLEHRGREIADAVTNHNALLRALKPMGGIRPAPGGTSIVEPIDYIDNANFGFYEGYELLSIVPQSVHTAVQYGWKNASVAVTISGSEIAKNSGPDQIKDMLRARIVNAERSMANGLASAIYHAGTEHDGKTLGGTQHLFPTDPTTGIVAGIDRSDAANAWWRSYASADIGDMSATTINGHMRTAFTNLVRGTDYPELIVSDATWYNFFNDSLLEIQRITEVVKGTSGFSDLAFRGPGGEAKYVFDPICPANRQYFLNLNTLKLRPHKDRNMMVSKPRESLNQDAQVVHIFWMGNLVCNNAALNGLNWT